MRHFLDLADWTSTELRDLIQLAVHLKREWQSGGNRPVLQGKILGMIFQKPSLRTRISFEVGMKQLGGDAMMIGPTEIGLGQRESVADVARVMSGYVQGIMARVFAHAHVLELAQYASIPVINGLSDAQHPCQAMADIMTIYENFGRTEGLRVAFVGDGNNVAASLAVATAQFGMHFSIATPEGYELPPAARELAAHLSGENGLQLDMVTHPEQAIEGADVIYTDTWVSMGQETESAAREAAMLPYQVNAKLLRRAQKDAIVMHCLPAHRGHEITDEVADGPQSVIFAQAENRLHAQKAILVKLLA
ncbi:MAG: ornithine carbamoyltransferase [Burkholderiales bacterium]|nr:ornithine carbamoyltransferase [Anaerolineae bacterium]